MKTMTWKTKLIIAAIVVALVLAGCGINYELWKSFAGFN